MAVRNRRLASRWRWGAVLLSTLLVGVLLYFTPTGYMIVMPGVAKPTADLVTVQGGVKSAEGRFLLVTVATQSANPYVYLFAKVWPHASVERMPQDPTALEVEGQRQMTTSQALAAVVAEQTLGLPAKVTGTGARITAVVKGGPSDGVLQVGDVVTRVAGHEVQFQDQLRDEVSKLPVGQPVHLTVRRNGQLLDVVVTPVPHPSRPGKAALLVDIDDDSISYDVPVPVTIDAGGIIGPSAGLMFSLEVCNQLNRGEDLTRGRVIAGTGTILPDGRVGPIGGVEQKVITAERAGATIFFAPLEDAPVARRVATKVQVVPVGHLEDALRFLRGLPVAQGAAGFAPDGAFLDKRISVFV